MWYTRLQAKLFLRLHFVWFRFTNNDGTRYLLLYCVLPSHRSNPNDRAIIPSRKIQKQNCHRNAFSFSAGAHFMLPRNSGAWRMTGGGDGAERWTESNNRSLGMTHQTLGAVKEKTYSIASVFSSAFDQSITCFQNFASSSILFFYKFSPVAPSRAAPTPLETIASWCRT